MFWVISLWDGQWISHHILLQKALIVLRLNFSLHKFKTLQMLQRIHKTEPTLLHIQQLCFTFASVNIEMMWFSANKFKNIDLEVLTFVTLYFGKFRSVFMIYLDLQWSRPWSSSIYSILAPLWCTLASSLKCFCFLFCFFGILSIYSVYHCLMIQSFQSKPV